MNKKTFTALFILISTLANLLLNFLVIALLAVISCSVLGHVLHVQNGGVYAFTLLACFVIGLLISFIIYTRLSNKIIIKFKMEQKFDERWRGRAGEGFRRRKNYSEEPSYTSTETPGEETTRKTNMPSSVSLSEEEKEEARRWGDEV